MTLHRAALKLEFDVTIGTCGIVDNRRSCLESQYSQTLNIGTGEDLSSDGHLGVELGLGQEARVGK